MRMDPSREPDANSAMKSSLAINQRNHANRPTVVERIPRNVLDSADVTFSFATCDFAILDVDESDLLVAGRCSLAKNAFVVSERPCQQQHDSAQ